MKRYTIEHCQLVECPNGGLIKYGELRAKVEDRLKYFEENYPKGYFLIAIKELEEILGDVNSSNPQKG